ncbi:TOTE conflict system archaeo-eukaryotic primase domain-containing protein [Agathobacter sp. LCP21S3_B2]|uniref:TOTE conflict system archaeo-eukaryotic primase domain-containing protein n=1 Tax=Agathobacter sp. LCP21S3_B2 TaxID=3438734 RepID=UPI003F91D647
MRDSIENISQLQKKLNDLQLENQILKNILDRAGLAYNKELSAFRQNDSKEDYDPKQGKRIIHPQSITENMANKFFYMFWGRQDVYAKRSVNKETGKAAYYPQCNNFWTSVCHKKIKDGINCKDCKNRSYKKITKYDILNHLQGNAYNSSDVIGVYPLLNNGTCRFMVFDFDNHDKGAEEKDFANDDDTWIEEVEAMRKICVMNGIDPLVERSRSGRGAHVWIFFDKPIAASLVRKFGFALLDKGAEQVNLKSFKYYDRMLPAQDSLPDKALKELTKYDNGILHAATAFGKTVVSSAIIAQKKVNTLIILESSALIEQWKDALEKFLNIDEELPSYETKTGRVRKRKSLIGTLQGVHDSMTGIIDIAMAGSLCKKGEFHKLLNEYGLVLIDECHHSASETIANVLKELKAKYVYGVTATPKRADGLEKINYMLIGPIRYSYTAKEKAKEQGIQALRFQREIWENVGDRIVVSGQIDKKMIYADWIRQSFC